MVTHAERLAQANRPEPWQKIRARYQVETKVGGPGYVSNVILPVTQFDSLLLVTRVLNVSITVDANVALSAVWTVPDGEFWHLKRLLWRGLTAGTYTWRVGLSGPNHSNPSLFIPVGLTDGIADDTRRGANLDGITMRPGDLFWYEVLGWSVESDLEGALWFDMEDCSS